MTINEVAKRLNISRRAIRFYEEKGLIAPVKQYSNRYRQFTEQEVWRLQTIITLREVGMSLDDIKTVLSQVESGNSDELLYYLELQRSALFSTWLEYKQQIVTMDGMINMLKQQQALPLQEIHTLAEGSRRLREIRNNWSDQWNFDHRAPDHDDLVHANNGYFRHYDQTLDTIYQWICPKMDEVGLDIGTGTGNLAGRFITNGYKIAAMDQSKEMLKQCQNKFPQLETRLGNFLAIPYLDGHFDFAVSSFAFHHLNDEQQLLALEEIKRVLKPCGRICIADIFANDIDEQTRIQHVDHIHIPLIPRIIGWFEHQGYMTMQEQLGDALHMIYAIPSDHH